MTPKSFAGIIALVLLMAQASEPFGVSDYPEAVFWRGEDSQPDGRVLHIQMAGETPGGNAP